MASIEIERQGPVSVCESGAICLVPTMVKLLSEAGTELDMILLAEYPSGQWGTYPVIQGLT